jgi:hypothetical protein
MTLDGCQLVSERNDSLPSRLSPRAMALRPTPCTDSVSEDPANDVRALLVHRIGSPSRLIAGGNQPTGNPVRYRKGLLASPVAFLRPGGSDALTLDPGFGVGADHYHQAGEQLHAGRVGIHGFGRVRLALFEPMSVRLLLAPSRSPCCRLPPPVTSMARREPLIRVLDINTTKCIGVWIPSKFFDQTLESRAEKIEMGSFRI